MDGTKPPSPGRAMVNFNVESGNGEPEVPRKPRLFDPGNLSQLLNTNPFKKGADFSELQQSDFRNWDPETQKEMLLFLAYRFVTESFLKK